MFVSPAYAQGATGGGFGGIEPLIPLVLIFVVFYFLLIRPQQKKAKAHREMLASLKRGDRIVTAGGIIGTIARVPSETELTVEIAENVRVRLARGMVTEVLARNESRGSDDADDEEDDKDDKDGKDKENTRGTGTDTGQRARS